MGHTEGKRQEETDTGGKADGKKKERDRQERRDCKEQTGRKQRGSERQVETKR